MFDLPGLDGVEQVVIGPDVVEGKARPLYIYAERDEKASDWQRRRSAESRRRRANLLARALLSDVDYDRTKADPR